jgi:hypothetical protein
MACRENWRSRNFSNKNCSKNKPVKPGRYRKNSLRHYKIFASKILRTKFVAERSTVPFGVKQIFRFVAVKRLDRQGRILGRLADRPSRDDLPEVCGSFSAATGAAAASSTFRETRLRKFVNKFL